MVFTVVTIVKMDIFILKLALDPHCKDTSVTKSRSHYSNERLTGI